MTSATACCAVARSLLWYKRVYICAYLEMLDNIAVVALSHGRQTDTRTYMQTIEYPPLTV